MVDANGVIIKEKNRGIAAAIPKIKIGRGLGIEDAKYT